LVKMGLFVKIEPNGGNSEYFAPYNIIAQVRGIRNLNGIQAYKSLVNSNT